MIRRFVNLVVHDYTTGARSLHRLDVAKHLFYPSTALADEAAASAKNKDKENINGGKGKPPARIRRSGVLRRLPPATMSLHCLPAADNNPSTPYIQETFALLAGGDHGKILHAGEVGQVVLYDAGSGSTTTLPDLALPDSVRHGPPIFISSIAGAGTGKDKKKESIYVITDPHEWHRRHSFQVLDDLSGGSGGRWDPLPLPPFVERYPCSAVKCFAVIDDDVDGGRRTICVSTTTETDKGKGKGKGTYFFDTTSRQWRKAGDWTLPFHSRAEHVPELRSWVGSCYADDDWLRSRSSAGDYLRHYLPASSVPDDYLCATSDDLLSAAAMDAPPHRRGAAAAAAAAPKLQHVWQDMNPADEEWIELRGRLRGIVLHRIKQWVLGVRDLINLGGGRFCVAKFFSVERVVRFGGYSGDDDIERADFVELSGVELVRGGGGNGDGDDGGGGGELRMVMHKSRRYMFTNDEIEWVL